jgi:phosphoribosyl-ATP pyrophosphohydrolase/phosphoribosyl-AMP cyclohydrolase
VPSDDPLMPVVVQDAASGTVLMVAFANREALRLTRETGRAHFYSRSRQALWDKGATSGQVLEVLAVVPDCDSDAWLYKVNAPRGACHTGRFSCFGDVEPAIGPLGRLWATIQSRREAAAADSYTRRLLDAGLDRILRKVGEEAAEFLVACKNGASDEITAEASDLLYHIFVALLASGVDLAAVTGELSRRADPLPGASAP